MPLLPFKLNQNRRRHIPRQKHRVINSAAYEAALRQRGSLTVWLCVERRLACSAGDKPAGRALHLGVDTDTNRIVAATLTPKDVDDASQVGPLLDQVTGAVASFTGDGGYDQDRVYASVVQRHPEAAVVVPPRANAAPSDTAEAAPTQRDGHVQHIAEHGRMAWQNASGYNRRARVEATTNRWKQVIGDELRARADERRATEVVVAAPALNRILELGHPSYAGIA